MMPASQTPQWGTSVECRSDHHGNCWKRTRFGGLNLACDCECHRGRIPGRFYPEDEDETP